MDIRPKTESSSASYPAFFPHITLASLPSDYPVEQARISVPESQKSVPVQFKSVDVGDHFFRSVYISVQPTELLAALHAQVHSSLQIDPKTPLFPHISLCYIADEDRDERENYFEELQNSGRVRANGQGVALHCGLTEEDWMSQFIASEIWLIQCDGPVKTWSIVEKIQLQ